MNTQIQIKNFKVKWAQKERENRQVIFFSFGILASIKACLCEQWIEISSYCSLWPIKFSVARIAVTILS